MPLPTWAALVPAEIQEYIEHPSTAVYAAEVVLDHAGILALTTELELVPEEEGVAFYQQEISVSHPAWNESYTAGVSVVRFSGSQSLEAPKNDVFGNNEMLYIRPRTADETSDLLADVGQPLTVRAIPASGAVTAATISGTAPAGTGSGMFNASGGSGNGVYVNISWAGGVYTLESVAIGGSGYAVEDEITILGDTTGLDGINPDNNVTLEVTAVGLGAITGGEAGQELRIGVLYTKKTL